MSVYIDNKALIDIKKIDFILLVISIEKSYVSSFIQKSFSKGKQKLTSLTSVLLFTV